jgi:hypothetical protein
MQRLLQVFEKYQCGEVFRKVRHGQGSKDFRTLQHLGTGARNRLFAARTLKNGTWIDTEVANLAADFTCIHKRTWDDIDRYRSVSKARSMIDQSILLRGDGEWESRAQLTRDVFEGDEIFRHVGAGAQILAMLQRYKVPNQKSADWAMLDIAGLLAEHDEQEAHRTYAAWDPERPTAAA